MNCLLNKETIEKLEDQMTFESMVIDKVYERVYSAFDGRIVATLNYSTMNVVLTAYSWDGSKTFDSIKKAAKWLIKEHVEYHKIFSFDS